MIHRVSRNVILVAGLLFAVSASAQEKKINLRRWKKRSPRRARAPRFAASHKKRKRDRFITKRK